MSETPVPRHPGRDANPPGVPAGAGDHPALGAPGWRLAPCSPDWDEAYLAAIAEDEDPGEYEDPDNTPPAALDDTELAELLAGSWEVAEELARDEADRARRDTTGLLAALGPRSGPGS